MSAARWGESILLQAPARLLVGGGFCLAAYMKLFDRVWEQGRDPTFAFAEAIKGYHILDPDAHLHVIVTAAYVIPWVELLAGALLIIGLWARPAALVSLVMLAGFTAASVSVILSGVDTSCACFGDLEWPCGTSITWCQVGRNTVLMLAAAYLVWRGAGLLALEAPGSGGSHGGDLAD